MVVIFTVFFFPAFFVFTLPLDVTVAYFMLLDFQRSFLLAPLPALTLAFNFSVFPAGTRFFPLMMIFLTSPFMIRIANVFFLPLPSVAIAVMLTLLPAAFLLIFTTPFLSTVASFGLLVIHFILLFGRFVVSLIFLPGAILLEIARIVILLICGLFVSALLFSETFSTINLTVGLVTVRFAAYWFL